MSLYIVLMISSNTSCIVLLLMYWLFSLNFNIIGMFLYVEAISLEYKLATILYSCCTCMYTSYATHTCNAQN